MEVAIDARLPTYSGGLRVLAGFLDRPTVLHHPGPGKRLAAHLLELVIPQQSATTLKVDAAEATPDFDDGDEQLRRGVTMS